MISIIIPVYNQAKKITKTLASLARQSYSDYEVIIVNDGSTDGVENVFAAYYKKLTGIGKTANNKQTSTSDNQTDSVNSQPTANHYLFINQSNAGAPAARNRGAREAQGDFLFFCDADAVLEPAALETMLNALSANPSAAYAYSSFYWGRKLFKAGEFSAEKLKAGPFIHTMSLIRRADFPAGGWDEKIKKLQDWDLWLTMLEQGKVGLGIDQVLFTVSPGGTISSWLPSFAYKYLPFLPAVKKYHAAVKIIKDKHGLG